MVALAHLHDQGSRVMLEQRRHIQDIYVWEESLELLHIVPAAPRVIDDPWIFAEPKRKCIKPFDVSEILVHKYGVIQDPDMLDRGRIRFPDLVTHVRRGTSRTASPPPRPDDPDGLRDENRRRRMGKRPKGPPCLPGIPENKSFRRDLEWERTLPDDDSRPYLNTEGANHKRGRVSSSEEPANKRMKTETDQSRSDNHGNNNTPNQSDRSNNGARGGLGGANGSEEQDNVEHLHGGRRARGRHDYWRGGRAIGGGQGLHRGNHRGLPRGSRRGGRQWRGRRRL